MSINTPAPQTANSTWHRPEYKLRRPEACITDLLLACAVAAFAVFWMRPFYSYNALGGDEGIAFQGAERILRGEIPYRDFFSFYTPGCYYFYAFLFRIYGTSIQVARTVLVVYAALFAAFTYLLAARACSRSASVLMAVLLTVVCLPSRFQNLHSWDSTMLALLSLYAAAWFLESRLARWAFVAGLLVGATVMVEQPRGAGLVLGLGIAAGALYLTEPKEWNPQKFLPALLGGVIPPAVTLIYFAAHHTLAEMFSAWLWPLQHYTGANKMPFGYIYWNRALPTMLASTGTAEHLLVGIVLSGMATISLLPLLVICFSMCVIGKVFLRTLDPSPLSRLVLLVGSVVLGSFIAAWATGRPDFLRVIYLTPLFFCTIPLLLDCRLVRLPALSNLQPLLVLYLLVSFTVYALMLRAPALRASNVLDTRRGRIRIDSPDEVLPYLRAHVPAGRKVLIYPYSTMYSFLSATVSPTRYDFLQPGMHTPADFEAAKQELARDRTDVVLFDVTFFDLAAEIWPSTPAKALAYDPTGDYILAHYRTCRILRVATGRHRPFLYMVRKDLPCPE